MTRRSLHREDELTFHRASADQPEGLAGALEGQRAEDPRGNPSGLSSLQSTWKSSAYGRVLRQDAPEPPPVPPAAHHRRRVPEPHRHHLAVSAGLADHDLEGAHRAPPGVICKPIGAIG